MPLIRSGVVVSGNASVRFSLVMNVVISDFSIMSMGLTVKVFQRNGGEMPVFSHRIFTPLFTLGIVKNIRFLY